MSRDFVPPSPAKVRILEAALRLLVKRGDAAATMAGFANAANISRQALYLHYPDRGELMLALVDYLDQKRGLPAELEKLTQAPDGVAALRVMVSLQARTNPGVWPVARAAEAVRRTDPAVEQAWQDRLTHRLRGCREIVVRLAREGKLRPDITPADATDLLWTLTSLRTWEDLVLERRWSAAKYEAHIASALVKILTVSDRI